MIIRINCQSHKEANLCHFDLKTQLEYSDDYKSHKIILWDPEQITKKLWVVKLQILPYVYLTSTSPTNPPIDILTNYLDQPLIAIEDCDF